MKEVEVLVEGEVARVKVYPREELEPQGLWPELAHESCCGRRYHCVAVITLPGEKKPGGSGNKDSANRCRDDVIQELYQPFYDLEACWAQLESRPGWVVLNFCPFSHPEEWAPAEEEE